MSSAFEPSGKSRFLALGAIGLLLLAGSLFYLTRQAAPSPVSAAKFAEIKREQKDKMRRKREEERQKRLKRNLDQAERDFSAEAQKLLRSDYCRDKDGKLMEPGDCLYEGLRKAHCDGDPTFIREYGTVMTGYDIEILAHYFSQGLPPSRDPTRLPMHTVKEKFETDPRWKDLENWPMPSVHGNHKHARTDAIEMAGLGKNEATGSLQIRNIPIHRRTVKAFGEDVGGVSGDGSVFVVADGVSDASKSKEAAYAAVQLVMAFVEYHSGAEIVDYALGLMRHICYFYELTGLRGATTLTIVQLNPGVNGGRIAHVINVGDSGAMAWAGPKSSKSKDEPIFFTEAGEDRGQSGQVAPFQLSAHFKPSAENVHFYEQPLARNDLLIIYSDGISDNLYGDAMKKFGCAPVIAAAALHLWNHKLSNVCPIAKRLQDKELKGKKDDLVVITVNIGQYQSFE